MCKVTTLSRGTEMLSHLKSPFATINVDNYGHWRMTGVSDFYN